MLYIEWPIRSWNYFIIPSAAKIDNGAGRMDVATRLLRTAECGRRWGACGVGCCPSGGACFTSRPSPVVAVHLVALAPPSSSSAFLSLRRFVDSPPPPPFVRLICLFQRSNLILTTSHTLYLCHIVQSTCNERTLLRLTLTFRIRLETLTLALETPHLI